MWSRLNRYFAVAVLLSCVANSAFAEDWICTEESAQHVGNTWLVCGVGSGTNEGDARDQAFTRAETEFKRLCQNSVDCRDFEANIEPNRTTCAAESTGSYKCYRGFTYTITDRLKSGVGNNPRAYQAQSIPLPTQANSIQSPTPATTSSVDDQPAGTSLGVGIYSMSVRPTGEPNKAVAFSGWSFWAGKAFFKYVGIHLGINYSKNTAYLGGAAHPTLESYGGDFAWLFGNNLDRPGVRIYFGLGAFFDTWSNGTGSSRNFDGRDYRVGCGYNFKNITVELTGSDRNVAKYRAFFPNIGSSVTARTLQLMGSLRF